MSQVDGRSDGPESTSASASPSVETAQALRGKRAVVVRAWSGTARRLLFAFLTLFLAFGVAGYLAMAGMIEVHDLLHGVKDRESGVRAALELASAVRDQYAHQAHTIILGNDTHLGFYDDARARVLELSKRVRAFTGRDDERAWLSEIEETSGKLDVIFRDSIVPAVLKDDRETVLREHAHAQELVSLIQDRADRLAASFESAIGDFEQHAATVEHATFRWSLILFLTAMALAVGFGLYVGNSVARPMAKLEAGTARLASGRLDTRIDLDTDDEFGRLARQFNRMTSALVEHQARLVESEKLAGIGRLAAGVAHEINNPLAVILGYTRLLHRKTEHQELAGDLAIIESEAVRCQQIVEGLLELARPIKLHKQNVELKELCEEVVHRLKDAGQLASTEVKISGRASASADVQQLRQVLTNLIKNAVEAAGPDGRVEIAIDEGATISIADTGPGFSPEHHLFEPFFTTKPRGTGLGLAISKAIAKAHGGDIEAENRPEGGAVFLLRVPQGGEARG